jgi:hypothetical protein
MVRSIVHRPAAGKPLDRNDIISGLDVADGADGRAPTFSGAAARRMVGVGARPSRRPLAVSTASLATAQRQRAIFKIGQRRDWPAARRNDFSRLAEIGIAHRDWPAAVVAPGIGLHIGEIGIPGYVNSRRRVRGPGQERGNLHLIALEQHNLDWQMRFFVEVGRMPSQIVTTFGSYATAPTQIVRFMAAFLADA